MPDLIFTASGPASPPNGRHDLMTDIDFLAISSYAHGKSVTETAVDRVQVLLKAWQQVTEARRTDPTAFPGGAWADTGKEALARRVLATLLDAGWKPPSAGEIAHELRRAADAMEQTPDDRILNIYTKNDLPPPDLPEYRRQQSKDAADWRHRADEFETPPELRAPGAS